MSAAQPSSSTSAFTTRHYNIQDSLDYLSEIRSQRSTPQYSTPTSTPSPAPYDFYGSSVNALNAGYSPSTSVEEMNDTLVPISQSEKEWCDICVIKLTKKAFRAHLSSKRHLRNEAKYYPKVDPGSFPAQHLRGSGAVDREQSMNGINQFLNVLPALAAVSMPLDEDPRLPGTQSHAFHGMDSFEQDPIVGSSESSVWQGTEPVEKLFGRGKFVLEQAEIRPGLDLSVLSYLMDDIRCPSDDATAMYTTSHTAQFGSFDSHDSGSQELSWKDELAGLYNDNLDASYFLN